MLPSLVERSHDTLERLPGTCVASASILPLGIGVLHPKAPYTQLKTALRTQCAPPMGPQTMVCAEQLPINTTTQLRFALQGGGNPGVEPLAV
jgi:hypothetical protein